MNNWRHGSDDLVLAVWEWWSIAGMNMIFWTYEYHYKASEWMFGIVANHCITRRVIQLPTFYSATLIVVLLNLCALNTIFIRQNQKGTQQTRCGLFLNKDCNTLHNILFFLHSPINFYCHKLAIAIYSCSSIIGAPLIKKRSSLSNATLLQYCQ